MELTAEQQAALDRLTPEQRTELDAMPPAERADMVRVLPYLNRRFEDFQNEAGVDLSLIEAQLRLTPTQRVQVMEQHVRELEALRGTVRRIA